jgi:hypothetical protein
MSGDKCSCIKVDANGGSLLRVTEAGGESYTMEIPADVLKSNGTICVCENVNSYREANGMGEHAYFSMTRIKRDARRASEMMMTNSAGVAMGAAGVMGNVRAWFWTLAVYGAASITGGDIIYSKATYDRSYILENLIGGATNAFDREITIEYTGSDGQTYMLDCDKNHLDLPAPGENCEIEYITKSEHQRDHKFPEEVLSEDEVEHKMKMLKCNGFIIHDPRIPRYFSD